MRRICCDSVFRRAARFAESVGVSALSAALLLGPLGGPGLAQADPEPGPDGPDGIAALIADVADANQRLQDLGATIETEKESVNKALVDVQTARDNAAAAEHDVEASRDAIKDADAAITAAQRRFDRFAVATYVNGPSDGYLTARDPSDMIATAAAGETLAASAQQVLTNLLRARTDQVNKESAARLAKKNADEAISDAQSSQEAAVRALTDTKRKFGEQQQQISELAAQRDDAQAKLATTRRQVRPTEDRPAVSGDRWEPGASNPDRAPAGAASAAPAPKGTGRWDGEWDPTLPMVPSAFVDGDPIAIINQLLGISKTSAQATSDMGRSFLQTLGLAPTPSGFTNDGAIPRVHGRQATEYVIRRGMSQIGVPYSWGGGNAAGPSRGIDSGAGTVGFDCSGLILYSFAGVGIKLPHYSGAQYDLGRKIPSSQARRGDVLFYGPGGSQHVTLYLGNGKMLEAPDVGQTVKVSPVRTSGMTPFAIRYIES
jgi:cell wall-associated NlpC family hydrolase